MKSTTNPTIFLWLAMVLLPLAGISCGDGSSDGETGIPSQLSDSFTFFDIGKNAVLSKDLRRELSQSLGDASRARNNPISLEIHRKGILAEYFNDLDQLNKRLNSPAGTRVEHRTVKLMFRHITGRYASFDHVEFLFSQFNRTPLLIRLGYRQDELAIVDTLKQKYGPPASMDWRPENAKVLYWQKAGDYLIHTAIPDRSGTLRYQIAIYYTERLRELIEAEQAARERERQKGITPAKPAF